MLARIRLVGSTQLSLFWAGGVGVPTGRDGFSFFLLALRTALPEELAPSLWPLEYLHIPQLLAPGAFEMFFFSVPLSPDLPCIFEFIHLLPVSIISSEFQRCASQLYGVVQCVTYQMGYYYGIR